MGVCNTPMYTFFSGYLLPRLTSDNIKTKIAACTAILEKER